MAVLVPMVMMAALVMMLVSVCLVGFFCLFVVVFL